MDRRSEVKSGDVIAVWFSCGAASAVAAKLTLERYGEDCDVRIVNCPVMEEDDDNLRFLVDVEFWLRWNIELALNPAFPSGSAEEVWESRRFMSSPFGAPCTLELKKEARRVWEDKHKPDWHVLGFTADEVSRHERFIRSERENVLPVLIDAGVTKQDCFKTLVAAGVKLPHIYSLGFPNANCVGCVKATSPTYWNLVRKHYPEEFERRARLSREIGCRLTRVKGKRIFLDELDPNANGNKLKGGWSCGTFCDPEPENGEKDEK